MRTITMRVPQEILVVLRDRECLVVVYTIGCDLHGNGVVHRAAEDDATIVQGATFGHDDRAWPGEKGSLHKLQGTQIVRPKVHQVACHLGSEIHFLRAVVGNVLVCDSF